MATQIDHLPHHSHLPEFTGVSSSTGLINPRLTNSLGDVIRRRRKQLEMSQHDLATAVGLEFFDIKQIERGADEPTLATRRAIALALELSPYDLDGLPITDAPPAARRRPDAHVVTDRVVVSPAPRLQTWFHVIVSHGEKHLKRDLNEAMRAIENAGYLLGAQHVMTGDGRYFTTVLRYQATVDLFPDDELPDPETDIPSRWERPD